MNDWYDIDGAPLPLGATWMAAEQAYNFALYTRHASAVSLLLFEPTNLTVPQLEIPLDYTRRKTGRVWHVRLTRAAVGAARYYAYRVDGPFDPAGGFRFDPSKVLLDPYARGVFFPPGYSRAGSIGSGSNAGRGPLGELPLASDPASPVAAPIPLHTHDAVIYEMHVRGFTERPTSGVSDAARGTFAGVIEKIPYLKELGVTAVELLPVYQFDPEDGGNYWGYMPLNFFSLHQAYSAAPSGAERAAEFRAMVEALHDAGIEVILDVVYNHTSEVGPSGPTYCYRGIDNSTYYLLQPDGTYRNDAGTGNVMRTSHPAVRRLITHSLNFWKNEIGVDGFRFDLASVFTRTDTGAIDGSEPAILAEISGNPLLASGRLIAEPWDLGTYQLGRAFPGLTWAQWNGKFRDDVRRFVKSDPGLVGALMSRLYGSPDLFSDDLDSAYRPQQSVNYVTCHDGFCLYDLVSYDTKHNLANGHDNTDGTDDNFSWNCGIEGDTGAAPEVLVLRRRQMKNFCCLLMLANGTPMFCAGDEFMNTQQGNNNPYNQDNEVTWLDWELYARERDDMFRFFRTMIAFRRAHPSIGRGRFWRDDVRWYGVDADVDLSYDSRTLAYCLHGASAGDRDLYVMINAYWEPLTFSVCEGSPSDWLRVVDTSRGAPDDILSPGQEQPLTAGSYLVGARSIVVLMRIVDT
jgi:isoamylase